MKNERRHMITERYPIIAIVFWFIMAIVTSNMFTPVFRAMGLFSDLPDRDAPSYVSSVIGAILFLVIMKLWYAPKYKGILKPAVSWRQVLLACMPLIIYSLFVLVFTLIQFDFYFNGSILFLLMALAAGFSEEIMFRASIIPISMGFFKTEKRAWLVPVFSGAFFGIIHLANIFSGATILNTIIQSTVNFFTGFYYGSLLVVTGSIVPGIVLHALYDYICFTTDRSLAGGVMVSELATFDIILNLILAVGLAAGIAFILKRCGTEKILKIWKDKWSQE